MTPTQRSLALLRSAGYTVQVVERWNPFARVRQDLFGFIDIVAVRPDLPGVLAIQSTSRANIAARRTKIAEEARARVWLAAGNAIVIHGWAKRKNESGRQTWQVLEERISELSINV